MRASDIFPSTRLILLSIGVISQLGCPDLGRPAVKANCKLNLNPAWKYYRLGFSLDQSIKCPIPVAFAGQRKNYAASVSGPTDALRGDILTVVYKDDGVSTRGGTYTYFADWGNNYSNAYVAFDYSAGYPTTQEAFRSDYAENTAPIRDGPVANAEVVLNYRLVVTASVSGPQYPAVGSYATWTASVANAPAPFSYRWFKDGLEISGEASASITLPVTSTFFNLKLIATAADATADTLVVPVVPTWNATIYGMTEVGPSTECGYSSYVGGAGSPPFVYEWILDGQVLLDEDDVVTPDLSIGSHVLELFVTDANGYSTKTSLNINVSLNGPRNCT